MMNQPPPPPCPPAVVVFVDDDARRPACDPDGTQVLVVFDIDRSACLDGGGVFLPAFRVCVDVDY